MYFFFRKIFNFLLFILQSLKTFCKMDTKILSFLMNQILKNGHKTKTFSIQVMTTQPETTQRQPTAHSKPKREVHNLYSLFDF